MSLLAPTSSTTSVALVIVDPDADSLAMYETFFESIRWDVSTVDTASAALARLGVAPRPRAVIFDFWLPDMTAVAFCQAIGALTGDGPPLRRIVVTGCILSADNHAALRLHGVEAIYAKPCDLDVLVRALQR